MVLEAVVIVCGDCRALYFCLMGLAVVEVIILFIICKRTFVYFVL